MSAKKLGNSQFKIIFSGAVQNITLRLNVLRNIFALIYFKNRLFQTCSTRYIGLKGKALDQTQNGKKKII